jgi:hypothetical protein
MMLPDHKPAWCYSFSREEPIVAVAQYRVIMVS